MNRFIYSFLFYLATPLLIIRLLLRSLRAPAYRKRWSERFAFYSENLSESKVDIIFHAVSVGEVHAAVPLINLLLATSPTLKILVTTSTPTGSARVTALLQKKVKHVYLPYDYPGATQRFINLFDPRVMVILETELWPNLINTCAKNDVKLLLANARLSEKSLRNYKKINGLASHMLNQLDKVTAQSEQDRQRLRMLNMPDEKIRVAGSVKFDLVIDADQGQQARHDKAALHGRPVLIAASTRTLEGESEEEEILESFQKLLLSHPNLLLVLVPRHPERFNGVLAMAQKRGFTIIRRSSKSVVGSEHQILLGDSMGEMQYYFGLADIAFVGGSLVATGCQNIIEPAALGLPVITGPSLFNFQAVSEQLIQAGGQRKVANGNEFVKVVNDLLDDNEQRLAMGRAAKSVVGENQGATAINLAVISELLKQK